MTATAATAVALVKARLIDNWTATPISWPREPFEAPLDGDMVPLPFVRFDPEDSRNSRLGIGALYDHAGRINLHVLYPARSGEEPAALLRSDLTRIFADQQFGGIRTEVDADIADAGETDNGAYNVSYISVRWRRWGGA